MTPGFVGIDVSKAHLDVALSTEPKVRRFTNDDAGIQQLLSVLLPLDPQRIALESTGGYEDRLLAALLVAKLPAAQINPRRLRDFARSLGKIAKTDALDAKLLALFAERCLPTVSSLLEPELVALKELVTRRRQLHDMATQERNRLETLTSETLIADIRDVLACLQTHLKKNDKAIATALKTLPQPENDRLLRSVPGVGPILSAALLSMVPELGRLNRKQIAALIGVAPMHKDSGTLHGKRFIAGGRPIVRAILYMAALSAVKVSPPLRHLYARLRAKGKVAKVALTACMRKLLCILNAVIRSKHPWQLTSHSTQTFASSP